jgi:hypothetical protein
MSGQRISVQPGRDHGGFGTEEQRKRRKRRLCDADHKVVFRRYSLALSMQRAISDAANHTSLVIVLPRDWHFRLSRAPGESGPDRRGRVFDDPVIPAHVGRQGDAFHPASAAEVTPRTDQGPADSVPVRARPGPPRSSRPSRLQQPKRAVWCARGAPSSPAVPARPLTRSARSDRSRVCGPGGRAAWSVARRSIRECGDARENTAAQPPDRPMPRRRPSTPPGRRAGAVRSPW